MIKFLALLFMLIDHIGFLFFPDLEWLRLLGRLSMPMFGYAIGRGYYYSSEHGTDKKYFVRLLALAVISSAPYYFMQPEGLNIVFTWVLSILVLKYPKYSPLFLFLSVLLPIDYSISGVLVPVIVYWFHYRNKNTGYLLGANALNTMLATYGSAWLTQAFSVFGLPLALVAEKYDNLIKINRWVFYWFYPAHITVLLIIKFFVYQ